MNSLFTISSSLLVSMAVLSSGGVYAQSDPVFPASLTNTWGQGSSSLLGRDSTRTQMILATPVAPGTAIRGVAFRRTASTTDSAAFTADVEIRISSTAATPGTLSSTFASNVGSDEVVAFPRQTVTVPAMPANRSTGVFAEFLFPQPFVFGSNGAPNLNVEVLVYGRSSGASWSTDRIFGGDGGREQLAGIGCGTASNDAVSTPNAAGDTYAAGSQFTINLTGATPNSLGVLFPSFNMSELFPGVPLPFSLAQYGAPTGCDLLVSPLIGGLGIPTDGIGDASLSLTVPQVGEVGLGWQWIYLVPSDPSNPAGIATTAVETTFIGPRVSVPNVQYVWDLFDVNAATGTATTNSCPVTKLIL